MLSYYYKLTKLLKKKLKFLIKVIRIVYLNKSFMTIIYKVCIDKLISIRILNLNLKNYRIYIKNIS